MSRGAPDRHPPRRRLQRVTYFDPYPHLYGGGQRTTLLLACELLRRGVDARVLTTGEGAFTERLGQAGVPYDMIRVPGALGHYGHQTKGRAALRAGSALPAAWLGALSRFRRQRPDVVHAVDLRGALLAGPAARLAGAATVWHAHLTEAQPALNWLASRLAQVVVLPSRAAQQELPGVSPRRVHVIANAVAPSVMALRPADLEAAWAPGPGEPPGPEGPTLVSCARLVPQKGLDVLVAALEMLVGRHPGLRIVVFGSEQEGYSSYIEDIRSRLSALGLDHRFLFAGAVEEPSRRFGDTFAYLQPSRYEILPLAILEAMAVGLPVVASGVGGVPEMVAPGRTGLLVPPGDATALAGAIDRLLGDPEQAAEMGRAGAEVVRERYQVETMADRWVELYTRLL